MLCGPMAWALFYNALSQKKLVGTHVQHHPDIGRENKGEKEKFCCFFFFPESVGKIWQVTNSTNYCRFWLWTINFKKTHVIVVYKKVCFFQHLNQQQQSRIINIQKKNLQTNTLVPFHKNNNKVFWLRSFIYKIYLIKIMIEHLETVHEEEKRIANNENNNTDQRSTGTLCIKRNLAPTNSSDGEFQFFETSFFI